LLGTAIVILGWPAYRFRADRGEPSVETAAPGWLAPAAETPAGRSTAVILAPSDEHGVRRETDTNPAYLCEGERPNLL
jgi:hypothetical protein